MKIFNDDRIVAGEHNGMRFVLKNGLLSIDGPPISRMELKAILEIVTLLEAQGHRLAEKRPDPVGDILTSRPTFGFDPGQAIRRLMGLE